MKRFIQEISKGDEYSAAECIDLAAVRQGKTLDELAENLGEVISLPVEGENPADFGLVDNPSILARFEVEPLAHANPGRNLSNGHCGTLRSRSCGPTSTSIRPAPFCEKWENEYAVGSERAPK
jgi:predicted RNase H-like HicB family nuclease